MKIVNRDRNVSSVAVADESFQQQADGTFDVSDTAAGVLLAQPGWVEVVTAKDPIPPLPPGTQGGHDAGTAQPPVDPKAAEFQAAIEAGYSFEDAHELIYGTPLPPQVPATD